MGTQETIIYRLAVRNPSYGQKMARNFWSNWAEIFMGVQETIIYWLVMINLSYDAYFSVLIFCATFGEKMGVATTHAPNDLGVPNPTKKLAHWMDLLQLECWLFEYRAYISGREMFFGHPVYHPVSICGNQNARVSI